MRLWEISQRKTNDTLSFLCGIWKQNKKQTKKTTNSQIQRREWWLPEGGVGGGPNGSRGSEGKLSSYKVSESWNLSCETTTKFTERWQVCHPCGQAGHPQGVDSHYLQVCKLHGGLSLEAQGLRNEGMQILQTENYFTVNFILKCKWLSQNIFLRVGLDSLEPGSKSLKTEEKEQLKE